MKSEPIYMPPFSSVRLHYTGRDTETFTPGGGQWRVLRFGSIVAMQADNREIFLVSKETEANLMNQVLRVVLPDGIHDLTEDARELLRFLDRAGVVRLHRDDAAGGVFRCAGGRASPGRRGHV